MYFFMHSGHIGEYIYIKLKIVKLKIIIKIKKVQSTIMNTQTK